MRELVAATLEDIVAYHKTYDVPNNAVPVMAGDIQINKTREGIRKYFGPVHRGETITRNYHIKY